MTRLPDGEAMVAGVAGRPIAHSLSPVLHNAWIAGAGLNAAYVPFAPPDDGFERFVRGLRGQTIRGLNVTAPFKERALELADEADEVARRAGSANVLLFHPDGRIELLNKRVVQILLLESWLGVHAFAPGTKSSGTRRKREGDRKAACYQAASSRRRFVLRTLPPHRAFGPKHLAISRGRLLDQL